jgi:hypothetical protein
MSIIFAGAPIVNAIVAMVMAHDWGIRWPFVLGIFMAASEVSGHQFKPVHAAPAKVAAKVTAADTSKAGSTKGIP